MDEIDTRPEAVGLITIERLPLDELHADAGYLAARVANGSMTIEECAAAIRSKIDAALSARSPAPAGAEGWGVRELEWIDHGCGIWTGSGMGMAYAQVSYESEGQFDLDLFDMEEAKSYATLEAAQAAAQADFAARIRACLVPAPADAAREAALLAALARIEGYALGLVGSEDRDAPWAVRKMLDYIEEQRRALAAPLPTEARDGE